MLWAQPKPCVSSLGHGSHLVPPLEEVRYLQNLVNILFIKLQMKNYFNTLNSLQEFYMQAVQDLDIKNVHR